MNTPNPVAINVGQFVPDTGREASVGTGVVDVPVGVGVADPQTQSVSVEHDGFLQ